MGENHSNHIKSNEEKSIKTIEGILFAEEEYQRKINQAKTSAAKIIESARQKVTEQKRKNESESNQMKNDSFSKAAIETNKKVNESLTKAKKEAETIRKKKLDQKIVSQIAKDILNSL